MSEDINKLERELQELKIKKYEQQQREAREREQEFKKKNAWLDIYGSDDYCGCGIGEYSFYYGYEETRCPVKSHKDSDDCDEKDCDKRERCFVASIWDKEVAVYTDSELGQSDIMEQLIAWIMKCLHEGKLIPPM